MVLRVFNSLTRQKEDFHPLKLGIYVCGVTVYDLCHVGHARVYVVFDSIVRDLRIGLPSSCPVLICLRDRGYAGFAPSRF